MLSNYKKVNDIGYLVLQTSHGRHLADFKKRLIAEMGMDIVQLVIIIRPSACGEYEPYHLVDTEQEFEQAIKSL